MNEVLRTTTKAIPSQPVGIPTGTKRDGKMQKKQTKLKWEHMIINTIDLHKGAKKAPFYLPKINLA